MDIFGLIGGRSMLFFLQLAKALRNNPEMVLLKLVGCFVSYQFSSMFCVFIAGMSMNAGYWKISLGLALGGAFVYGVKGDPVGFWRDGDFLFGPPPFDD